jgi:hypothetical protein
MDHTAPTVKPYNASKAHCLSDQDKYQRAFKTLCQDSPIASLDVPTIQHIKDTLYPQPYPCHTTPTTQYNTRSSKPQQQTQALTIKHKSLLATLRSFKNGTTTGPLANYTDFYCNFAFYGTKH